MVSTHLILVYDEQNGAEKEASALVNDTPISAYFIAAQSLALYIFLLILFFIFLILNNINTHHPP